ncbi:taurine ABC transporter substrate-binding protein [Commensalibacter oyaizuii]|uniref:ABC transporter substrate-binding protein n=1 Tax=Commensalibacter oyaizuii TaxID=3043873 RepID=A0ABT6Q384_9PROT|nr:ABC transporter substrate-binding protein [Commensalibacter sp. TBRC 16381]MDI2091573.1 ABC transporter substrate-binding protein [Commensalibacter sp. TBRC 16381]
MTSLFLKFSVAQVKRHGLYYLVLFLLLLASFVSCDAKAAVRIAWQKQADLAKIAQVNGTYRKALGENVTWIEYKDDFQELYDLAANKLDIAPVGIIALTSAVTSGVQVRVIAINFQYGTGSGLVVRNQSHVMNPDDITNKKIAVPFLTSEHYSLLKALDYWKIPLDRVKLINMPIDQIVAAWDKGEIDGAYVEGKTFLDLKKTGYVLVTSKQLADWGSPTYTFWVTMDNIVASRPDLCQNFVDATLKLIKDYNQKAFVLTSQSKDLIASADLLKLSPQEMIVLIQGQEYLEKREQSLLFTRRLPAYFNEIGLFLRSSNVISNVLSDYLLYVYPTFVNDAKVK